MKLSGLIALARRALLALVVMATQGAVVAAPLDPAAFPSQGPNPFGMAGSYVFNTFTTGPATLSGPSGPMLASLIVTTDGVPVFVFDSILIGPGVTIRAIGGRPLAILSKSTFQMTGGELNLAGTYVAGTGYVPGAGGGAGGSQQGGGGPGGGTAGTGTGASGGGGGHATAGGNGGGSGAGVGGVVYGNLVLVLQGGSGGGGGSDLGSPTSGAPSGGAIEIGATDSISIAGVVNADGYFGQDGTSGGGGGGGSGGGIFLHAPTVTVSGTVRAAGGNGGHGGTGGGGGGGGAGRIHVLTATGSMTVEPAAQLILTGGFGGGGTAPGQTATSSGVVVGTLGGPNPMKVAGCIKVAGLPLMGATVKFKQRGVQAQTTTDSAGCYGFLEGVTNRTGTLTIELPALP